MLVNYFFYFSCRCRCHIVTKRFSNFNFVNEKPKLTLHVSFFSVDMNWFRTFIRIKEESPAKNN